MSPIRFFGCVLLLTATGIATQIATGKTSMYLAVTLALWTILIIGDGITQAIKEAKKA